MKKTWNFPHHIFSHHDTLLIRTWLIHASYVEWLLSPMHVCFNAEIYICEILNSKSFLTFRLLGCLTVCCGALMACTLHRCVYSWTLFCQWAFVATWIESLVSRCCCVSSRRAWVRIEVDGQYKIVLKYRHVGFRLIYATQIRQESIVLKFLRTIESACSCIRPRSKTVIHDIRYGIFVDKTVMVCAAYHRIIETLISIRDMTWSICELVIQLASLLLRFVLCE